MLQHEIFDLKTRERERENNYMRRKTFEEKLKPNKQPKRKTQRTEARFFGVSFCIDFCFTNFTDSRIER